MKQPFHRDLEERIRQYGDISPGCWRLVADIVKICASHMDGWTNRYDDAQRIPDVLAEASAHLLSIATVTKAAEAAKETT